uniref:ATP synthase complex subunit 8 n=1 Tax=Crypturopus tuberculatus TaxID=686701 RepID=A0A1L5BW81_9CRUS|nr:ATP synthase F0 subunit 8 [Crypturopus tuberculatus]
MPQMAPSMWTLIFFLVSVAMLAMVTMLYFCSLKTPKLQIKASVSSPLNSWPW